MTPLDFYVRGKILGLVAWQRISWCGKGDFREAINSSQGAAGPKWSTGEDTRKLRKKGASTWSGIECYQC